MLQFMPGSPFNDEKLTTEQVAVLNQKYGLDKPVYIQFFNYVKNMLSGDFGVSYTISKNTPIAQALGTRLPTSIRIGGQAVFLGTIIGLFLGIVAALNHKPSGTHLRRSSPCSA
jgi:oligopeptide transport system permease protein